MWQPLYEQMASIPLPPALRHSIRPAPRRNRCVLSQRAYGGGKGRAGRHLPRRRANAHFPREAFRTRRDVITHGLDSTPVVLSISTVCGHPQLERGPPFSSRLKLRHEFTIYVGEPVISDAGAAHLHRRVLEIGTQAAQCRRVHFDPLATGLSAPPKRHWHSIAVADSTGKQLSFGETLTTALFLKNGSAATCAPSRCVGLLLRLR